ncbi:MULTISPECIES: SRPBCC domain-containing protein [Streptosporangium]|uniref:SRPBCC domain-containing protein n=1 Tax=Streptosporangium brasiliense TaxID=47480 RepID=A0ABT9QYR0_9ACTN|nr:SRPBCC domain-containing protein [Streptosporangium brasiliense]MDP9862110.1 hypothetical protein [Streptosporangium brasiliense]
MREITASIDIAASPEHIWNTLTDFSGYSEWNPMFIGGSGELVPGGKLALRMPVTPGGRAMTFTTTVLVADGRLLRWRGRLIGPAVFEAVHEFALAPHETGTRLTQREALVGALVPVAAPMINKYEQVVIRLNEALRNRCQMG